MKKPDGTVEIEGERAYPIHRVVARWLEDPWPGRDDPLPWQVEGAPPGRWWNSTSYDQMSREESSTGDLVKECRRWWLAYSTKMWVDPQRRPKCPAALHASDPIIVAVFDRYETWCMSWFSHWTFDAGQTDAEVLTSFQRYVYRAEREGQKRVDILMGAEDRWRWHGTKTGSPDEKTDPPCRCIHCKRAGVIRIGH